MVLVLILIRILILILFLIQIDPYPNPRPYSDPNPDPNPEPDSIFVVNPESSPDPEAGSYLGVGEWSPFLKHQAGQGGGELRTESHSSPALIFKVVQLQGDRHVG